jgi:hypothetical protein
MKFSRFSGYFLLITFLLFFSFSYAQVNIKWNGLHGGGLTTEGNFDEARSIKKTSDGGMIIAGTTNSIDGDIKTENRGGLDIIVTKASEIGTIEWVKTFGGSGNDICNSIINTLDGGYLLSGYSNSSDGDLSKNLGRTDVWLVKISSNGIIQWQKSYGGTFEDEARSAVQAKDGGYVIIGTTFSRNGDIVENKGQSDIWVLKIDTLGSLIWQKTYGGNNLDQGNAIVSLQDNSFIIGGSVLSANGDVTNKKSGQDAWVVKINATGVIQWQKAIGGNADEYINSIIEANDGSIFFTGGTTSNDGDISGNKGSLDVLVVKLNSSGNLVWQKCFGGSLSDAGNSIVLLNDGSAVVVGYTGSSNFDVSGNSGLTDIWAIRVSNSGDLVWQNCLGGTGSEIGYEVSLLNDALLTITGRTDSNNGDVIRNNRGIDQWVVNLATSNNLILQKTFGGTSIKAKNIFNKAVYTPTDKGSIAVGYTNSYLLQDYKGKDDFYVSKFDSVGAVKWQKTFGGTEIDIATSICMSKDGGYVIAGYTLSDDGDIIDAIGEYDGWVIKIDSVGTLEWQQSYGGVADDFFQSVISASDGGYVLSGHSFSSDGDALGNKGDADFWVIKISETGSVIWKKLYGGTESDISKVVINSPDNGYYVVGNSYSENGDVKLNKGIEDILAFKLNKDGNLIWQQSFGGAKNEEVNAAIVTPDSSLVIVGWTSSNDQDVTSFNGAQDVWLLRVNSAGVLQWQKTFGGSGSDVGYGIVLNTEKELTVVGTSTSADKDVSINRGLEDLWLLGVQNDGNLRWQKTFGGSNIDRGYSIDITAKGNYLLSGFTNSSNGDLQNISSNFKADSKAWLLEMNNCPIAKINANGPAEFCSGQKLVLKTPSATAFTFQWFLNGAPLINDKKDSLVVTLSGNYYVATNNAAGCTSKSDSLTVKVNQLPSIPVIQAQGPTTFCQGKSVDLKINTVSGIVYDWLLNGNSFLSLSSLSSINATQSGNYTAIAQNQQSGCRSASSSPVTVTTNAIPARPTIALDGNSLISSKSTGNQWFLNNNVISGATTQKFTPIISGGYTLTVTENNCESLPSTVYNFVVTSVQNFISGLDLNIYPNPVAKSNKAFIKWNTGMPVMQNSRVIITDISGKTILDKIISHSPFSIDVPVIGGVYFIQIKSKQGKLISTSKILVQ